MNSYFHCGPFAVNPFPNYKFYTFKLKEFADDNSKFDENDGKFSKWIENTGKRRNCSLQAFSPFPAVFSKDSLSNSKSLARKCLHDKRQRVLTPVCQRGLRWLV